MMILYKTTRIGYLLLLLLFAFNAMAQQDTTIFICNAELTSEEATIIIPNDALITLNNAPLPHGTIIRVVYEKDGEKFCAGQTIWEGQSTYITVVGNDEIPPDINGYLNGQEYSFCFVTTGGCVVSEVTAAFKTGPFFDAAGFFTPDGTSGIGVLSGTTMKVKFNSLTQPTCQEANGSIAISVEFGEAPFIYTWSNDSSLVDSVATGLPAGEYEVKVTDRYGCAVSLLVMLVDTTILPVVDLGPDLDICPEENPNLFAGNAGVSYEWFLNNDRLPNADSAELMATGPGQYAVIVTSATGCTAADSVLVNVLPEPVVNLPADSAICKEANLLLDVSCNDCQYSWSTGETTAAITVSESDSYAVTVTNAEGCSGTDSIAVTVNDLPVLTEITGDFMPETNTTSTYSVTANSGSVYLWEITSGSQVSGGTTNSIVVEWGSSLGSGEICVTETDANGCTGEPFCQLLEIVSDVPENKWKNKFTLAPNPVNNQLLFQLAAPTSTAWRVSLSDVTGRLWMSGTVRPGQQQYRFDTSLLPAGHYWLKATAGPVVYLEKILKF